MSNLTVSERAELEQHEATIAAGLETFVEVGRALVAIRDQELFRQDYATFEGYCRAQWGISRPHAYRLISAAEVVLNVSPIGDTQPATESIARPLTRLEPEQQRAAWAEAVETAPEGKVTAAHVERVVERYREPAPQPHPLPEPGPMPEPEMQAANATLRALIEDDPDVQRATFRHAWSRAVKRTGIEILTFDPTEVAAILEPDDLPSTRTFIKRVRTFLTRLEEHLDRPSLSVVR